MDEYISEIASLPLFGIQMRTHDLKHQQVPIRTADQQIYTVAKEVQWSLSKPMAKANFSTEG